MSEKTTEVKKNGRNDYHRVHLDNVIVEEGFNVREELKGIDELARSIAKFGQQNPGKGYKIRGTEQFVLTGGHRRLAAIKLANEKYGANIQYIDLMSGSNDEKERVMVMLLDGDASQTLSNEEMVRGVGRLLALGMKKKEIMESLAINASQAQKYNLIKAATAPEAVQKMIDEGLISVSKVNALQRENESDEELINAAETFVAEKQAEKESGVKKTRKSKNSLSDVQKLEQALELVDGTNAKAAVVKAIVNKLKANASPEDIAKLLA